MTKVRKQTKLHRNASTYLPQDRLQGSRQCTCQTTWSVRKPIQDYRLCDIRRGMVILRQDHTPYPLSIRDNIALGLPERGIDDQATVAELKDAARLGGASAFINKLKNGMGTVLRPPAISRTYFPGGSVPSLKAVLSDRSRKIEISGGESQRLAAYVHYTTPLYPGLLC